MDNELTHHGILGMKWGVRRFQNSDGSLTQAGKRRTDRRESKWIKKNANKITDNAKKKSSRDLDKYSKELLQDPNAFNKSGNLSAATINAYNKRMAALMNEKVSNLSSPSGKAVQFVAKRSEVGVMMALADQGYDMDQLRNGIYSSGKVAYRQTVLDKA